MLKRAVLSRLQPFVADHVYTVRHGLARGLKRRGGLGFVPQVGTPPLEETFLDSLDFGGQTVFDVGGYEGIFTLFFARRVGARGRVVTFEPNPRNHSRIVENVRLNAFRHVDVRPVALGARHATAALVFPDDETARGSLVSEIQDQIRQEGDAAASTVDVEIETLDRLIAGGLAEPDFVKIDVEGFEREVLEGMSSVIARRRPRLYIEMHGADRSQKLHNAASVIDLLWRSGYRVHHVESGANLVDRSDAERAAEGHVYCD